MQKKESRVEKGVDKSGQTAQRCGTGTKCRALGGIAGEEERRRGVSRWKKTKKEEVENAIRPVTTAARYEESSTEAEERRNKAE